MIGDVFAGVGLRALLEHLPALRERVEDIEPLVRAMAARFNQRFKKELFDISSEAITSLESYGWPGNVRELEKSIEYAVLVSKGNMLLPKHLPEPIQKFVESTQSGTPTPVRSSETLVHNREVVERSVILRALANHGFSRARAANELGISRVTLYKKMKKYNLLKESART